MNAEIHVSNQILHTSSENTFLICGMQLVFLMINQPHLFRIDIASAWH